MEQIIRTSSLENTDFTICTEMWLKDTDEDRAWIATSRLDNNGYGAWKITVRNRKITLLGIYHPPIGSTPCNTHVNFLYEVSQLVQYFITSHKNIVLLGDFNIHVQDLANQGSLVYNDTMEAMELIQHIIEPTYQLRNTLDLMYTESLEVPKVLHAFLGYYMSDHRLARIES